MSEPSAAEILGTQGSVVALLAAMMDDDAEGCRLLLDSADHGSLTCELAWALIHALLALHGAELRPMLAAWEPGRRLTGDEL